MHNDHSFGSRSATRDRWSMAIHLIIWWKKWSRLSKTSCDSDWFWFWFFNCASFRLWTKNQHSDSEKKAISGNLLAYHYSRLKQHCWCVFSYCTNWGVFLSIDVGGPVSGYFEKGLSDQAARLTSRLFLGNHDYGRFLLLPDLHCTNRAVVYMVYGGSSWLAYFALLPFPCVRLFRFLLV